MSLLKLQKTDVPQEALQRLREWTSSLKDNSNVVAAYVFGSAATNTMHAESDIDIALIVDNKIKAKSIPRPLKGLFPTDFVVISQEEFQQRKAIGGISWIVANEGIEIFPTWRWLGES